MEFIIIGIYFISPISDNFPYKIDMEFGQDLLGSTYF